MTTTEFTGADFIAPLPFGRPSHVAAVTLGNALEFYDFLTCSFFAAQIGRTFFPLTIRRAAGPPRWRRSGRGFICGRWGRR
jgi:hypothetical protein